jgi:hypothetical protein
MGKRYNVSLVTAHPLSGFWRMVISLTLYLTIFPA